MWKIFLQGHILSTSQVALKALTYIDMGCRTEKYNSQMSYMFIVFNTCVFNWECASFL
jgi:hypothetical protein